MKKTLIVGILLTTLLLGGCASQSKKEDPLTSENMKYSTMSDEDTQKKVSDFLSKIISIKKIFLCLCNQFNTIIKVLKV